MKRAINRLTQIPGNRKGHVIHHSTEEEIINQTILNLGQRNDAYQSDQIITGHFHSTKHASVNKFS